jgi:hypothetical protein
MRRGEQRRRPLTDEEVLTLRAFLRSSLRPVNIPDPRGGVSDVIAHTNASNNDDTHICDARS